MGVSKQVFAGQVGAEKGGVVGVEGDEQTQIEAAAQWVRGKRGADAGADVGSGVEFEAGAARL